MRTWSLLKWKNTHWGESKFSIPTTSKSLNNAARFSNRSTQGLYGALSDSKRRDGGKYEGRKEGILFEDV